MALVEYEVSGDVALLTLNRPEKLNAIHGAMAEAIESAIDRMEADEAVRVGLLRAAMTGRRPVFCAGHDLSGAAEADDGSSTVRGGFAGITKRSRDKPMIAVVDGLATGGGCEVALACDIIVASKRASFALAEARWNFVAAGGGLFRLTRIIGRPVAMDVVLTGAELTADRAFQLGLVSRLAENGQADQLAMDVAREICSNGPRAVRLSRKIVAAAEHLDDEACWRLSEEAGAEVLRSADVQEGVRAFAEKRSPQWTGR